MGRIPQFSTEEYPRTQGDVDSYQSGLDRVMALRFCESLRDTRAQREARNYSVQ